MNESTVGREELSKRLHSRLSGTISYRKMYHSVSVIIDAISKDLVDNQIVTVRCFGTLSPYTRPGHIANDLSQGKLRTLQPKKSVRFHPSESFLNLLVDRQERFRDKEDSKTWKKRWPRWRTHVLCLRTHFGLSPVNPITIKTKKGFWSQCLILSIVQ